MVGLGVVAGRQGRRDEGDASWRSGVAAGNSRGGCAGGFFTETPKNLEVAWLVWFTRTWEGEPGIGQIGGRMADESGLGVDWSGVVAHGSPEAKLAHRFSAGRVQFG
jgi:hypothetical protein